MGRERQINTHTYIHTYIHTQHTFRKTISGNQARAWFKNTSCEEVVSWNEEIRPVKVTLSTVELY